MIPSTRDLEVAASILRDGGLAAVPTETVFGLAADATNGDAVARIFAAKGRPGFNPLISHVADADAARRLALFDPRADALAGRFWPGPLTLVLAAREPLGVHPLVTAGLDTLALRVPIGPLRQLAEMCDRPLAAPSANRSGQVSATLASHVSDGLGPYLDAARDVVVADSLSPGGGEAVGVESTIVSLAGERPTMLRPGGLPRDEIERVLGKPLAEAEGADVIAPGMLASHYAPRGTLRLDAARAEPNEFAIRFGPLPEIARGQGSFQLSQTGNLREAARNLYAALHAANAAGADAIAVAPLPREGLGEAIADRLARAAAPR